jgi:hypothetical protein
MAGYLRTKCPVTDMFAIGDARMIHGTGITVGWLPNQARRVV